MGLNSILRVVPRIIAYNFYKRFGFPKKLPVVLTLSVNDWCNSRCKTCNIWKNNPKEKIEEELKLEEYGKIFDNYGKIYWLTITGGEPFLRNDLAEIVKVLYYKNKPNFITIATNGILTDKIFLTLKKILRFCKKTTLIINLSLDGIGKQHDKIRGVSGNFNMLVKTFKMLRGLNSKRLIIGINTVISKYNVKNFSEIHNFVINNLKPDSFVVEIAENRAKLYNTNLKIRPKGKEFIEAINALIIDSQKRKRYLLKAEEIIRRLRISYYKSVLGGKFPKGFEGIASGYIMSNGELWLSYSKKFVVGNLRDVDYDLKRLWFSKRANLLRRKMNRNYSTMSANAFYVNLVFNPMFLFNLIF